MGLLDDAIREHIELKRRAGEDAQRLAQLEHEAFGPIRRGDPALDLQPPGAATATPDVADAPLAEPAWEDEAPQAAEPAWEVPDEPAPTPAPEVPAPAPAATAAYERPPAPIAEPEPEPPRVEDVQPLAPEPAPPQPAVDQPTAAYSLSDLEELGGEPQPSLLADPPAAQAPPPPPTPAPPVHEEPEPTQVLPPEDLVPADDEPGEHDVLEETPEFLEETPEHDRLWFEQKPPRDFEF